jgi:hypothetical protein
MNWSDLESAIGKAAPILGTLLGGPAGAAVGSLISSSLGIANTPDALNNAIAADPTLAEKLQEIQINSKVQLQQLQVTAAQNQLVAATAQYQAEAADRDSARKLAAQQPKDWIRPSIAIILTIGVIGLTILIFGGFAEAQLANPTSAAIIGTVLGYLFNELKQVYGFYFGMTKDGSTQTNAITQFAMAPGSVTTEDKK